MISRERNKNIVLLESHEGTRKAIQVVLEGEGFQVHTFDDSEACLELISVEAIPCDMFIIGLRVLPVGGLELIKMIKKISPVNPIVVVTATGNVTLAVQSLKLGAFDVLEKPINRDYLISTVHQALAEQTNDEKLPAKSLLTKTEYEVLMHILDGKSTKEISSLRHRSVRTIEDQRAAVMRKLEVDNLVDLVKRTAYVVMPFE